MELNKLGAYLMFCKTAECDTLSKDSVNEFNVYLEFCKVFDCNYTPVSVFRFKEFKNAGLTI